MTVATAYRDEYRRIRGRIPIVLALIVCAAAPLCAQQTVPPPEPAPAAPRDPDRPSPPRAAVPRDADVAPSPPAVEAESPSAAPPPVAADPPASPLAPDDPWLAALQERRRAEQALRSLPLAVEFNDVPLRDVARILAAHTSVALELDARVDDEETVTLAVREISAWQALQLVRGLFGLTLRYRPGAFVLAPEGAEDPETRPYEPGPAPDDGAAAAVPLPDEPAPDPWTAERVRAELALLAAPAWAEREAAMVRLETAAADSDRVRAELARLDLTDPALPLEQVWRLHALRRRLSWRWSREVPGDVAEAMKEYFLLAPAGRRELLEKVAARVSTGIVAGLAGTTRLAGWEVLTEVLLAESNFDVRRDAFDLLGRFSPPEERRAWLEAEAARPGQEALWAVLADAAQRAGDRKTLWHAGRRVIAADAPLPRVLRDALRGEAREHGDGPTLQRLAERVFADPAWPHLDAAARGGWRADWLDAAGWQAPPGAGAADAAPAAGDEAARRLADWLAEPVAQDPAVLARWARQARARGWWELAARAFERRARAGDRTAVWRVYEGECRARAGDFDGAARLFDQARREGYGAQQDDSAAPPARLLAATVDALYRDAEGRPTPFASALGEADRAAADAAPADDPLRTARRALRRTEALIAAGDHAAATALIVGLAVPGDARVERGWRLELLARLPGEDAAARLATEARVLDDDPSDPEATLAFALLGETDAVAARAALRAHLACDPAAHAVPAALALCHLNAVEAAEELAALLDQRRLSPAARVTIAGAMLMLDPPAPAAPIEVLLRTAMNESGSQHELLAATLVASLRRRQAPAEEIAPLAEQARAEFTRQREAFRGGDPARRAWAGLALAGLELPEGPDGAARALADARLARRVLEERAPFDPLVGAALATEAAVHGLRGDWSEAARCWARAAADAPPSRPYYQRMIAAARAQTAEETPPDPAPGESGPESP